MPSRVNTYSLFWRHPRQARPSLDPIIAFHHAWVVKEKILLNRILIGQMSDAVHTREASICPLLSPATLLFTPKLSYSRIRDSVCTHLELLNAVLQPGLLEPFAPHWVINLSAKAFNKHLVYQAALLILI